jgi:C4-dicarboxylate-specific signal transduction histidine kinase
MKNDTEQLFSLATLGFFAFSLVHNLANQFTQLLYYLDEAQQYLPQNTHSKLNKTTLYLASVVRDSQAFLHETNSSRKTWFNVQDCIEEALTLSEYEILQARTTVSVELRPFQLYGNRIVLLQILLNVLKNSLQSLQTQKDRQIRIITASTNTKLHITVSDTGGGIKKQQRAFQRNSAHGHGVGLSYCRHHMEADFSGTLDLRNSLDKKGCVCTLRFPALPDEKSISQSSQSPVE